MKSSIVILLTWPGGQYTAEIVVGIWFNNNEMLVAWRIDVWNWGRAEWIMLDFIMIADSAWVVPSGWSQWCVELPEMWKEVRGVKWTSLIKIMSMFFSVT